MISKRRTAEEEDTEPKPLGLPRNRARWRWGSVRPHRLDLELAARQVARGRVVGGRDGRRGWRALPALVGAPQSVQRMVDKAVDLRPAAPFLSDLPCSIRLPSMGSLGCSSGTRRFRT